LLLAGVTLPRFRVYPIEPTTSCKGIHESQPLGLYQIPISESTAAAKQETGNAHGDTANLQFLACIT